MANATRFPNALSARALRPVLDGLATLGLAVEPLLATAGIEPALLEEPDAPLPPQGMPRLWQAAEAASGDPDVGLHVAEAAPLASFEIHGYALLSSPSLRDAYRRGCRYQRLINERSRLAFDEEPWGGILHHSLPGGGAVPRQPAEFLVATWLRLGREVVGHAWLPRLVRFAHPAPPARAEHERLLGPAIDFSSGATALHVAAAYLDRRNPRADKALAALLDRFAGDLLARRPADDSAAERLRHWLALHLEDGPPTVRSAARALAMSERSLHRSLAREGTRFAAVLDALRRTRAEELMKNPRHSLADVAFLLGFGDSSSFHRAFRRWRGETPGEARERLLGRRRESARTGSDGQRN